MPHFGLMDEARMTPGEAALLRSRLHMRSGRRLLREGKTGHAVATIYDALGSAMRWRALALGEGTHAAAGVFGDMEDEKTLYHGLLSTGALSMHCDYGRLETLVEKALDGSATPDDGKEVLRTAEDIMTQLGVLPFDEATLPPEKPPAS